MFRHRKNGEISQFHSKTYSTFIACLNSYYSFTALSFSWVKKLSLSFFSWNKHLHMQILCILPSGRILSSSYDSCVQFSYNSKYRRCNTRYFQEKTLFHRTHLSPFLAILFVATTTWLHGWRGFPCILSPQLLSSVPSFIVSPSPFLYLPLPLPSSVFPTRLSICFFSRIFLDKIVLSTRQCLASPARARYV